jgi:hypothetical protein
MKKSQPVEDYGERRFVGLDKYTPYVFLLPVNDGAVLRMTIDTEYMAVRRDVGKFNDSGEPVYAVSGFGTRIYVARMAPKDQELLEEKRKKHQDHLRHERELIERSRARAKRLGKRTEKEKKNAKRRRRYKLRQIERKKRR